ncbi:Rab11 family-interacting protein 1 [Channa argus]|uniref:Rab11 family-interacting protein 1 n=1 Tax=Channa argus TaxID=215402 RepID=A0A6G1QI02_CHAAH|nr:Rab11 family-interacting protein 1 [Channa argus]
MSLADQQWCPTSVQVTVLQARGLRIKGKSGTNDAYAIMQVGKEKYQTSVVEKSVAPVWKEEAAFDLPPQPLQGGGGGGGGGGGERGTLHVHVLHRALVGPDKLLGQAVINLLQLSEDESRNKTEWFKLLDKTGKADKDRGQVLLDIQFMRNNMTGSMFDLSTAGKSRSRLGKFKDKVRGKKKESDAVSNLVPSFTQVLTDSEEEAHVDGEVPSGKDEKKKKHKIKSLFSPKSNLQNNMSQSMSVLPGKNSTLSGSQSSGLNVESSEGKKKFKFMIHKRSGSSDSKDSSFGHKNQGTTEQSNLCINGSHVYREEPQTRTSRIGSNFSLASSGRGSMEEVPESSLPSTDSLRAVRQYSPWMEEEDMAEEENIKEDVDEEEEEERIKMEEQIKKKEDKEERVRRQEELEKLTEEKRKREEEEKRKREEEEKRIEERVKRKEAERIQREEERKRQEEKERVRREEQQKLAEQKRTLEIQERRIKEEKRQREEEESIRMEKDRALEQQRKQEEEEKVRREEEHKLAAENRRLKEEERRIAEEKVKKEEEEIIKKEEERAEEERKRQEEEERVRRQEEEHEIKKRIEEQKRRQKEEEERRHKEEERARKEKEECDRLVEEKRKQEEESKRIEAEENFKREQEERIRRDEERRKHEEEQEKRRLEEKRQREERERIKKEEERRREEEERARKEKEEYERVVEEKKRQEEQEKKEEEKLIRKREQERIRMGEERRREEEEQEQMRRLEEQERKRAKEEEKRQREEQEKIKIEEEKRRKEEERARKEKEEYERAEEKKRQEEQERRQKEELIIKREQERIRMEEEKKRYEEEERIKREREEIKRLAEEKRRLEEEEKKRTEEDEKNKSAEVQKAEGEWKENEARKLLEKEKLTTNAKKPKERDNSSKGGNTAGRRSTVAEETPADLTSTKLFQDSYNPFEEDPDSSAGPNSSTTKVSNVQLRCQATVSQVEIETISNDERNMICAQREKRPAPQPPGRNQDDSHRETDVSTRHVVQMNKQSDDRDIKTASVLPQRSVQMIAPVSRSPTDTKSTQSLIQSSTTKGTSSLPTQGKRPAPPRPGSMEEEPSSEAKTAMSSVGDTSGGGSEVKAVVYGLNPFEDEEDENEAQISTSGNTGSTSWSPDVSLTASQTKIKSLKVARAPPPPADVSIIENRATNLCASKSEAIISVQERPLQESQVHSTMEEAGGKQDMHPSVSRRLQPVKPLNPLEQQPVLINKGETDNKSTGILGEVQNKTKVNDTRLKGPYSQLTQEELISLVLKQEKQLKEKDKKISELEQYIDNLLVRVIEEKPSILMSLSSMKKAV